MGVEEQGWRRWGKGRVWEKIAGIGDIWVAVETLYNGNFLECMKVFLMRTLIHGDTESQLAIYCCQARFPVTGWN